MNKMSKLIVISSIALSGQACTQAGPFVTNISSDGANGLNVEKCMVEMNSVLGGVSSVRNKDCVRENIKIR
jgi:type IV secretion system protein VirB7